jgi:Xaa-Pro aminopeptidase
MKKVFAKRREKLKESLLEDASGRPGVALFFSGETDGFRAFEPDPTFYYLTGVAEPRSALAIFLTPSKASEMLFLPESNPADERWTGKTVCAGGLTAAALPDGARKRASKITGHGSISAYHELETALLRPFRDAELLYLDFPREETLIGLSHLYAEKVRLRYPFLEVRHGGRLAGARRRVKDSHELATMRQAMAITCKAQEAAARVLRPGQFEYEVRAEIEYVFSRSGAQSVAFPSIIGSGPNTCVLHYEKNDRQMRAGELVVCDVGCRKDLYCADVTRTYPVSGKFNRRQSQVYDAVLAAHHAAVAAARPGALVRDVHQAATESIAKAGFAKYFFHGTSHYLGLEAHDVGSYEAPLEPGVVITIEPGIYIAAEGLGVRIEDDVLITREGAEIMTDTPRDRSAIEKLMASGKK